MHNPIFRRPTVNFSFASGVAQNPIILSGVEGSSGFWGGSSWNQLRKGFLRGEGQGEIS